MKLALGTVQFGLDYGVSNTQGQVDKKEVAEILSLAHSLGIDTLDCAGAYGNSEQVIGETLCETQCATGFNLISKIPTLDKSERGIDGYIEQSLTDLKTDKLDALLFHDGDNLIHHPNKGELFHQLEQLKAERKISRIGASLYHPAQLKTIAEQFKLDLVQVPLNIFDQRFISAKNIALCQQQNITLHVRSLFLQGLIFLTEDKLARYFTPYKAKLRAFSELAQFLGCSKLTLALAIVAQELPHSNDNLASDIIEKVVIGVCSSKQLTEIVEDYQKAKTLTVSTDELIALADDRLGLINPSLWSL